jgi:hypothetical protein
MLRQQVQHRASQLLMLLHRLQRGGAAARLGSRTCPPAARGRPPAPAAPPRLCHLRLCVLSSCRLSTAPHTPAQQPGVSTACMRNATSILLGAPVSVWSASELRALHMSCAAAPAAPQHAPPRVQPLPRTPRASRQPERGHRARQEPERALAIAAPSPHPARDPATHENSGTREVSCGREAEKQLARQARARRGARAEPTSVASSTVSSCAADAPASSSATRASGVSPRSPAMRARARQKRQGLQGSARHTRAAWATHAASRGARAARASTRYAAWSAPRRTWRAPDAAKPSETQADG